MTEVDVLEVQAMREKHDNSWFINYQSKINNDLAALNEKYCSVPDIS